MNAGNHYQIQTDQSGLRPEWLRIPDATRLFGLSRSKLYELISDRRVRSFCLRERNKLKGVRLINYDSLSEYLAREASAQLGGEVNA